MFLKIHDTRYIKKHDMYQYKMAKLCWTYLTNRQLNIITYYRYLKSVEELTINTDTEQLTAEGGEGGQHDFHT